MHRSRSSIAMQLTAACAGASSLGASDDRGYLLLRALNVGSPTASRWTRCERFMNLWDCASANLCQSGNVVFKTRERNLVSLAKHIEDGIERTFGFRST